jgi:type III pantothenate kinase
MHFYRRGATWSERANSKNILQIKEKFYYINVNEKLKQKLESLENATDLEPYIKIDTAYKGLGIDRTAACRAIDDGVIVDAGSAITVDIMAGGLHLGGYIMPGLFALQKSFATISPRLDMTINPNTPLDLLPQNSLEAISYGAIKPIILMLKESQKDKKLYFTGGDGKFFAKFFNNAIYDSSLVFKGMLKVINERGMI